MPATRQSQLSNFAISMAPNRLQRISPVLWRMRFYLIGCTSVSVHAPFLATPRPPRFSSALYIRAASARVVLPSAIKHRKTGSDFGLRRQTLCCATIIFGARFLSSHNDCSERFKCHTLAGRHVHVNTSRRHR